MTTWLHRSLLLAAACLPTSCASPVEAADGDRSAGALTAEAAFMVITEADAFPVTITGLRLGSDSERKQGYGVLGTINALGGRLEVAGLRPGYWRFCAVPAEGSPRERDGSLVATVVEELVAPDSVPLIVMSDDSRWLDVQVVDEAQAPLAGMTVSVDSEIIGLASARSDARGRCRIRVIGPGPFFIRALEYGAVPRRSWTIIAEDVPQEILRLEMPRVAAVHFELRRGPNSPLQPARLRFERVGAKPPEVVERDLTEDSAWVLPTLLDVGDWSVRLLAADGTALGEKPLHVAEPGYCDLVFEI